MRLVVLTTGGAYGRWVIDGLAGRDVEPEAVVLDVHRPTLGVALRRPRRVAGVLRRRLAASRVRTHVVGNVNDPRSVALLRRLAPELLVLAGARILSPEALGVATLGALNAHPAHLPGFRGTGVVGRSMLAGLPVTVTVHFATATVDAGDVVERRLVPIEVGDNLDSIQRRADRLCAETLADVAARLARGEQLPREPQREPGDVSRWLSATEREQAEVLIASGEVLRRYREAAGA